MNNVNTTKEAWDILREWEIATYDELTLITTINGDTIETYEDVLYARTGHRCFTHLDEQEEE